MAEWDPLGEPTEAAGSAPTAVDVMKHTALMGMEIHDDSLAIAGSSKKVGTQDLGRMFLDISRKLEKDPCWQAMPDQKADLSWHKPACTLDKWSHKDVKVELGTGVAYITLNRPAENNVLSDGVLAGLCDAIVLLHGRKDIRVAVFSGEGKMLSAGLDQKGDPYGFGIKPSADVQKTMKAEADEALKGGAFPDGKVQIGRMLQTKMWHAFAALPQFAICLANGSALGDGLGLVTCCDMTIALKGSFFGFPDTKLGMVNGNILPYVCAKTSAGVAKNMSAGIKLLSAEDALNKGIVNQVVESLADARTIVKEMCGELTKCGPRSVELAKELVLGVAGQQMNESMMFYTMAMASKAAASEEAKQSLEALAAQKPKPWEGVPVTPLH